MNAVDKKEIFDRITNTRREHLEKMAAAFFKEVGNVSVFDYALVERLVKSNEGYEVRWAFEKIKNEREGVKIDAG